MDHPPAIAEEQDFFGVSPPLYQEAFFARFLFQRVRKRREVPRKESDLEGGVGAIVPSLLLPGKG